MASVTTRHYAVPPGSYFWKWSEDGTAFEWSNGATIAFTQEIFAILQSLAEQNGIPPLGSLLLIHAATSGSLEQFEKAREQLVTYHPDEFTSGSSKTLIAAISYSLNKIAKLPPELRQGTRAKAQLCHTLFNRNSWAHQDEKAHLIVQELQAEPLSDWAPTRPAIGFNQRFIRDASAVIKSTAALETENLENLIRTGIEFPDLSAAPFEKDLTIETNDTRTLLEKLAGSDDELGALASIARQVIGLIALPLPAADHHDLPIGGVSDIVNRGTPDKLLTSELAWGDDILASRLAQNEALYYHRETPPKNTSSGRIILLDHGLRYWGLLRLFALATHLGIKCHGSPTSKIHVTNLVATPDACEPFSLDTPSDVKKALTNLPTHLNFDPALAQLATQISAQETDFEVNDVFIISSAASLHNPGTNDHLATLTSEIRKSGGRLYVIEVTNEGDLTVSEHRARGNRLLQEGKLDLDCLLPQKAETPKQQTPKAKLTNSSLEKLTGSRFYNHYPPPLRRRATPIAGQGYTSSGNPDLFIGCSSDDHVMRWEKNSLLGEELSAKIPGQKIWVGPDDEGNPVAATSGQKAGDSAYVFRVKNDGSLEEIAIEKTKHTFPRRAVFQGAFIIFIYADFAEAFSLQSGRQVATRKSTKPNLHEQTVRFIDGQIAVTALSPPDPRDKFIHKVQSTTGGHPFRIIEPIRLSFTEMGTLLIRTSQEKTYLLNTEKLTWDLVTKPSNFKNIKGSIFEETGSSPPTSNDDLRQAKFSDNIKATYDLRGYLHLSNRSSSWSITLDDSSVGIWQSRPQDDLRPPAKEDFITFLKNIKLSLTS